MESREDRVKILLHSLSTMIVVEASVKKKIIKNTAAFPGRVLQIRSPATQGLENFFVSALTV
ncbi:hypothetical protein CSA57_08900 [candidate division KSB3 bacterium]|nr:MAG: hypothetical protein CSA57_08900 [candidate division KSB3 bacterium]